MKDKKSKKTVSKTEYRELKHKKDICVYIDEKTYLPIPKEQYDKIINTLHIDSLAGREVTFECGILKNDTAVLNGVVLTLGSV